MAASFYTHALNTETYDLGLGRGGSSRSDIPFYVELAREAGSTVLELACGTGQVTLALAQAGYIVTGLDRSSAMLRVARDKLDRTDPEIVRRVHFLQEDMASFELGTEFDAIFIPFRSFQFLLTTEAQRACLDRVSRHLRPGGTFAAQLFDPLLDLCVPDVRSEPRADEVVHPATGQRIRVVTHRHPNDPVAQVLHETWTFSELDDDGNPTRSESEELALRWTYRYEMRHLLELAGLDVVAEYADFAGSPPAYGREQVWVARRPS